MAFTEDKHSSSSLDEKLHDAEKQGASPIHYPSPLRSPLSL